MRAQSVINKRHSVRKRIFIERCCARLLNRRLIALLCYRLYLRYNVREIVERRVEHIIARLSVSEHSSRVGDSTKINDFCIIVWSFI